MATPVQLISNTTSSGEVQYLLVPSAGTSGIDVGDVIAGVTSRLGGTVAPGAGQVGQTIAASVSTAANAAATTTYKALTSVALTPGVWQVSGAASLLTNGATMTQTADFTVVIGTTSASATGGVAGQSKLAQMQAGLVDPGTETVVIPPFSVVITSATTYYLNVVCTFSAGTPQWVGSINAIRVA